jgi:hypothetical protein
VEKKDKAKSMKGVGERKRADKHRGDGHRKPYPVEFKWDFSITSLRILSIYNFCQ